MRGCVILAFCLCAGCGAAVQPAAPEVSTSTQTTGATSTSSAFTVDLPVRAGETATAAYGIWPFGVHGSSHALDGHPGFDVEFAPGASVRAAADGVIQNLNADTNTVGRWSIRISHSAGGRTYATDYTNVDTLASGIVAGASVQRGQALGLAGVQSQMIGTSLVTFAMTHFQVNDFLVSNGLTNPNAVSPESLLSDSGRALFATLWTSAAYAAELTEPLASNDRNTTFPLTKAWVLITGAGPDIIEFTRVNPTTTDHAYAMRTSSGSTTETGTVGVTSHAGQSTIDFTSSTGAVRRGVYDIVDRALRLNLADAGVPRPLSLAGAAVYSLR